MKKPLLFLACMCLYVLQSVAQTPQIEYNLVNNSFNSPVGIYHAGDERLFVIEQSTAQIKVFTPGSAPTTFLNINAIVGSGGERGLLGLAFHPEYTTNGYFFVNYTNNAGNTVIARYAVSANPNVADVSSGIILMTINQDFSNHNGGHIAFGPDGYLYIGMGDGGSGGDPNNRAQSPSSMLGKMLRIDPQTDANGGYDIPADNPYVGVAGTPDEIYNFGVRNPWKFNFDGLTGDLWIADVGQSNREEVNYMPAGQGNGANYGWRCYEGLATFNTSGCAGASNYVDPVKDHNHAFNGDGFCSISGGVVYRGSEYPNMYGRYFYSDLCNNDLFSLKSDGNGGFTSEVLASGTTSGPVMFGEGFDGKIYVVSLYNSSIYEIVDACGDFQPSISTVSAGTLGISEGATAQWFLNGNAVATGSTYAPAANGAYYAVIADGAGCSAQSNTINWGNVSGELGCTYTDASNYSPTAAVDDGSCEYNCPLDVNGDDTINTQDLLTIIGGLGTDCD